MSADVHVELFPNGLTLLIEPMAMVQSVAFSIFTAAGAVFDPPGKCGCANVLSDIITRGAGTRDSQDLTLELDRLGVQRGENAGSYHLSFSAATLGSNLAATLPVYADILRRPHLPCDEVEPAVSGARQSLRALEDEPRQRVMVELRRRCYPRPWALPSDGLLEEIEGISEADLRNHYAQHVAPAGTIIAVAGQCNVAAVVDQIGNLFGDWSGPVPQYPIDLPLEDLASHIPMETAQTHIGFAWPAVNYVHPRYYDAWAAAGVLSGGMSARLSTHVREERGLCYSIGASLHSAGPHGRMLGYAGTTTDKAQQTLDVTVREITRLKEGVTTAEISRCQARAKSSLIMQQESSLARSSTLARDWYHLKRVVPLSEIRQKVEAVTPDSVVDYVTQFPADAFQILTIGSAPLELPGELS